MYIDTIHHQHLWTEITERDIERARPAALRRPPATYRATDVEAVRQGPCFSGRGTQQQRSLRRSSQKARSGEHDGYCCPAKAAQYRTACGEYRTENGHKNCVFAGQIDSAEWGGWDSNPRPTDYESAALTG